MASFRQRGRRWYVEVRRRGVYRSGTFRTKTQARQWSDEIERAIDEGRPLDVNTVADALRRYEDEVSVHKAGYRWERVRLRMFADRLSFVDRPIERITATDISAWRDQRLREVSAASVRREMTLLSGVFSVARREWQWIVSSPMQDVRKPSDSPHREQLISDEQASDVFAAAGYTRGMTPYTTQQVVAAALDFALQTAMRAGEIVGLSGDNIRGRTARLPKTKNGTARNVPLSKAAIEILSGLDDQRPFPVTSGNLSATFRKLVDKAGHAGKFTFHDSRATAITRLAKLLDIHDLARMTGHKNLSQLTTYYRATADEIAQRLD